MPAGASEMPGRPARSGPGGDMRPSHTAEFRFGINSDPGIGAGSGDDPDPRPAGVGQDPPGVDGGFPPGTGGVTGRATPSGRARRFATNGSQPGICTGR